MIRPVLTEVALFLVPFVLYAVFLVATRRGLLHPDNWPWARLAWLTIAALILMLSSFIYLANHSGAPVGREYVPAHVDESGQFVPGRIR
ncbi:MAG: hypothetical protein J0H78_17865 [Rhizobiales bacterium]|nr:hypothetical protein [Hyphomicrobiales bacterium]MBX3553161.1 hypothetical protein [Pseudolabrys sp.]MCW5683450.1 hypothetical protein [Pseudolabrys sp.]OJY44837.1 MAG: hypothetical protein BGP08_00665 [Rhizobiales bacterium 64-17]